MARYCWLPPTKRPPKDPRIKARKTVSTSSKATKNSISNGMLKRLEPVFIPKKGLYKRGILSHNKNDSEEKEKEKMSTSSCDENVPKLQNEKPKCQTKESQSEKNDIEINSTCRALFPDKNNAEKDSLSILDIAEENNIDTSKDRFGFFEEENGESKENGCGGEEEKTKKKKKNKEFKKPVGKPKLSKKSKQKRINQSVIEIIRKTQQSIQEIRSNALLGLSQNSSTSDVQFEEKTRTCLNVQVSMCVPNKGIQKSKCTVQQSGSIEEESIGYQHERTKTYQDIESLI